MTGRSGLGKGQVSHTGQEPEDDILHPGRVRVSPLPGLLVDVFVTHTAAWNSNIWYRNHQINQLIGWVNDSDADFVILGGDLNTNPIDNETGYRNLKMAMVNSMEEFFLDKQARKTWVQVFPNNCFSGGLA